LFLPNRVFIQLLAADFVFAGVLENPQSKHEEKPENCNPKEKPGKRLLIRFAIAPGQAGCPAIRLDPVLEARMFSMLRRGGLALTPRIQARALICAAFTLLLLIPLFSSARQASPRSLSFLRWSSIFISRPT
jgi:hypothetical protein